MKWITLGRDAWRLRHCGGRPSGRTHGVAPTEGQYSSGRADLARVHHSALVYTRDALQAGNTRIVERICVEEKKRNFKKKKKKKKTDATVEVTKRHTHTHSVYNEPCDTQHDGYTERGTTRRLQRGGVARTRVHLNRDDRCSDED